MDAIECSTSAIDILHSIYQKAEQCLQNCALFINDINSFPIFFFFVDYQSSFIGPSTPFLRFDHSSEEFIFVMKTKSFVEDDFSFGKRFLLNR